MKSKILFKCVLIILLCIEANCVIAQWTPTFPNITTPNYVGIGTTTPASALHIDGNGMSSTVTGEVFRTVSPITQNAFWRLLFDSAETGKIFSQTQAVSSIDNYNMSIMATKQDITFHIPGADIGPEAMRIVGVTRLSTATFGGSTMVNAGNVGIGNKNPVAMLHIGGDQIADFYTSLPGCPCKLRIYYL